MRNIRKQAGILIFTVIVAVTAVCFLFISCEDPELPHICTPGTAATCTTAQRCIDCDELLQAVLGHNHGPEATCTASQNCMDCGVELNEMLDHDWEYDQNAVPPTCTTEGYGHRYCNDCEANEPGSTPYDALGHEFDWVITKTPTCSAAGEETEICHRDGCNHNSNIKRQGAPALGHNPGNWVQTTAPTCTAAGIETGTCTREGCNVPNTPRAGANALGHNPGNWVQTTAPTCTAAGIVTGTCTRANCNQPNTPYTGAAALGHNPGNWVQTTAPTCTTAGIETGTCTRCIEPNEPRQGQNALGHEIGNWTIATHATYCTDVNSHGTGLEKRACTRASCSHVQETRVISCLGTAGLTFTDIRGPFSADMSSIKNSGLSFVCIPDYYGDIPVVCIDGYNSDDSNNTTITNIRIGKNVTSIVYTAFADYIGLTSIEIPAGVTDINSEVFWGCINLVNVTFAPGSKLNRIGSQVFAKCYNLSSITLPNSLTTIGQSAFASCNSLTQIIIPNNVTFIDYYAFSGSGLTSIEIPAKVGSIGRRAFGSCENLTSITVVAENQNFSSWNGILYNKNGTTLIQAPGAISGSLSIPNNVTTIDSYAFYLCTKLTNIVIPATVTTINTAAFSICTSLTSITIQAGTPPSLGYDNSAFSSTNNCQIRVPAASVNAYKTALGWSTYASRIVAM